MAAFRNRGLLWLRENVSYRLQACLEWPFSKNWDGYGRVTWRGQAANSHRVMCILVHGDPPSPKHQAAHKCGNTSCVHPEHLYWATPSENQLDIAKHDHRRRRRLNKDCAEQIRKRLKDGDQQIRIAEEFGISARMVRLIATGECWASQ